MPTYESDDEEPIRRIYTHGALPEIPGSDNAKIAPLRRDLFAQDILNEEDRIRPIYSDPGASRRYDRSDQLRRTRTFQDPYQQHRDWVRLTWLGGWHSSSGSRFTSWNTQEISCEYNQQHNLFLQYIQFSLGGVPDPERAGTISPRAVYRTWPGNLELPDQPFWVKYHKFGYSMRVVPYDYAVGRVALLAYISENISISNQLVEWAKKAYHAQLHYLHDEAAEDTDDEDILDRLLDRPTF
ncbi:hypothetical protein B0H17DRAFT_1211991 [Mycena rosella]|uniref:Uncharacterized protein n=1 Tax=Mycena rosella TaxID=1033263 RepID=A0AAD7CTQ3_MYCRO|nr:hypothetical protein B0H17DRAFT_1211991 [Mycena rosella]